MLNLRSGPSPSIYRRACNACTASKRRCTKQFPACNRCAIKGYNCTYPPTQRNQVPVSETNNDSQDITPPVEIADDLLLSDFDLSAFDVDFAASVLPPNPASSLDIVSKSLWFVAPDSWKVEYTPLGRETEFICEDSLSAYIETVQNWFKQWVVKGHCPLVHRQLYRMQMPRCIQNAFTALAAYENKTESTRNTVFRIINDQASELVWQYSAQDSMNGDIGIVEHLARVQALLVFQVIRLYDGDIRLRARAEAHSPILAAWNSQMLQLVVAETTSAAPTSTSTLSAPSSLFSTPWKAWSFIESVRRTWLTTSILNSVYETIRDGISACPGGIICTFGQGLWDAESEFEWEKRVAREGVLFRQSLGIGELRLGVRAGHVDEFGHAVMVVSHGLEGTEKWVAEGRAEAV